MSYPFLHYRDDAIESAADKNLQSVAIPVHFGPNPQSAIPIPQSQNLSPLSMRRCYIGFPPNGGDSPALTIVTSE
jgi:hypothetical protein